MALGTLYRQVCSRARQAEVETAEGGEQLSRRRTVWDDFRINAEGASQDYPKVRTITRETPEILAVALATEDHKQRWELLREYAARHRKRCALRSWLWLEDALMSFDVLGG